MRIQLPILLLVSVLLFACKDKFLSPEERLQSDIQQIEKYLSNNGLTAESTSSGLHYIITEPGFGGHPNLQDSVTVGYKGYLLDGTVFDQTAAGQTVSFKLAGLITGWQECIPLLQKTGKGQFFLPSALGYGDQAKGSIPANSILVFDINLVDFH